MAESTTDNSTVDNGADLLLDGQSALPANDPVDTAAATTDEPTSTETKADAATEGDDKSVPAVDEKLASFAKGQGIEDLSDLTAREMSLLKSAYDNKAEQDRVRQQATQLEKSLTTTLTQDNAGTDPDVVGQLAQDVQSLKLSQQVQTFWTQNPDAKELEPKMAEMVTERPELGQLVSAGYLSLNDLYNLAKSSDPNREATLKQEGGREALEKVATNQRGRSVPGNATSSQMAPDSEDPFLVGFDKGASKY